MRIEVEATDEKGRPHSGSVVVPLGVYQQKTSLIFPFRGKGIILQAGAANGGHRNRSGQFALDAFGLDDAWSIIVPGDGKKNANYLGWGRPLVAPADGTVVSLRSDRPDQPIADASDPKYYAPEYPGGGDPGNHLVIDHGGGEYSMIAHFQEGSILVKLGEKVRQGQTLGKLGHSGDTSGPHVHYQLQAGPDWENADRSALQVHQRRRADAGPGNLLRNEMNTGSGSSSESDPTIFPPQAARRSGSCPFSDTNVQFRTETRLFQATPSALSTIFLNTCRFVEDGISVAILQPNGHRSARVQGSETSSPDDRRGSGSVSRGCGLGRSFTAEACGTDG
jgi:Peptidase family M23